jgi:hypothetical protein
MVRYQQISTEGVLAINFDAAIIKNKVVYTTDLSSLKKVMADIRKVQQSASKSVLASSTIKQSRQQAEQTKRWASETMDAHVKAMNEVRKSKASQFQKSSQDYFNDLFGIGKKTKSARESGYAFLEQFQAQDAAANEIRKRQKESLRRQTADQKKIDEANIKATEDRLRRKDVASSKQSFFGFELGKTRLGVDDMRAYTTQMRNLSQEYVSGSMSVRQYNESTRQLLSTARQQSKESLTLKERLMSIRGEMVLFGVTAGFVIKDVVDTGKQFQQLNLSFDTAFGKDKGEAMDFVRSEADRLGMSVLGVSKNYARLAYGAKLMGMSQSDVQMGFSGISEAATAWGLSNEQVQGTFKAFTDMISKGTVQLEELNVRFLKLL